MKKRFLSALALLLLAATSAFAATTTHYSFVTPTVGASQNVWGTQTNTIWTTIDSDLWGVAGGLTAAVNAPAASSSNITLTNPMSKVQNIQFSASGKNLILPAMNATASMQAGGTLYINNVGSFAFGVLAQDGSTTVISSVAPGNTIALTLISGATANGSFQFTASATNSVGTILGVAAGGTGASTLAANSVVLGEGTSVVNTAVPGAAGTVLTSNGTTSDPSFQANAAVPTGSLIIWTTTSCPANYTYANGQALSRTTFATLFAAIGSTYGNGDGSTTFNVPDTRGYFIRGFDNGAGVDPGRVFATTQSSAIASHTVTSNVNDPGHSHTAPTDTASYANGSAHIFSPTPTYSAGTASVNSSGTNITVSSFYSGASETRPVNLALTFCIKN